MTDENHKDPDSAPLNPKLRETTDASHDTGRPTAPLDSTGAHEGSQGEAWPVIWLVVTVISVVLAIYYLV